jgi:hypothetical protein
MLQDLDCSENPAHVLYRPAPPELPAGCADVPMGEQAAIMPSAGLPFIAPSCEDLPMVVDVARDGEGVAQGYSAARSSARRPSTSSFALAPSMRAISS